MGHGTASADELSDRLRAAEVELLVDVRRYPTSRRHPHLSREALQEWLPVGYRWEERLGGRRPVPAGSPDVALRNSAFRGYAAWMRDPDFASALREVLAAPLRTAVMCSESVWWRCHRRLVADAALLLHDTEVQHLMPGGRLVPHPPTDGLRVAGSALVYDVLPPGGLPSDGSASHGAEP